MDKNSYKNLFLNSSLYDLASIANEVKQKFHNDNIVTFVIDRNVNYTNICACKCDFCHFYDDEGYVLSYDEIKAKVQELIDIGGTQLLLQGGLNENLEFEYYTHLISSLRADFPQLTIHAFSPSEITFFAQKFNMSLDEILRILIKCGLSSIPGAGAEILVDNIRNKISPNKISSQQWLDVMENAHNLGLKTTATMVFGGEESLDDIIEHLLKIKNLQLKTDGFRAFIPWTFQGAQAKVTSLDYLKILALSRIILDNIPNIQASWVTQGIDIAQLALQFGANDVGGTMMEENVVSKAGCNFNATIDEIILAISKAGYVAAKRDTAYKILEIYE